MVFNATFNNNLVILWRSVWLVEDTEENYRAVKWSVPSNATQRGSTESIIRHSNAIKM